jgi:predicted branched-subunit amino acid permease
VVVLSLPAAAAVAVFGSLYGAAARGYLGVPLTLVSSVIIYSGALQFALVALLGAGRASCRSC